MPLKCAICGTDKDVDAVCHHCGRPICQGKTCRYLVINDVAFRSKIKFANRLRQFLQRWVLWQKPSTVMVAYHCRVCKEKFHPFNRTFANDQVKKPAKT